MDFMDRPPRWFVRTFILVVALLSFWYLARHR
jgi:hypothetical protein